MAKAKPFKPFNLNDLDIYKDGSISQEDVDILIPFGDYNSNLYDSPGAILKEIQKLQSLDEDEINFSGIDAISKPKKKFIEEQNKAINFLTNKYEKFTGGDEPDYRGEPDKAARQDAVDMVKVSKALQEDKGTKKDLKRIIAIGLLIETTDFFNIPSDRKKMLKENMEWCNKQYEKYLDS